MSSGPLLPDGSPRLPQRLQRALLWVGSAMAVMGAVYAIKGRPHVTLVLGVSLLLLLPALLLARRGRLHAAADWMLGLVTLCCATLALFGQGLRDTALLAFPGSLVFVGLLRPRRVLGVLLAAQLVLLLLIGLAQHSGLLPPRVEAPSLMQVVDIAVLLGLTAFAVWHLSADLRQAVERAQQERERALDSLHQLEHSTRVDRLTQLPNRLAAKEQLSARLQSLPAGQSLQAALFNLDGFATLNDAFGPQVSDQLLATLAQRLREQLESDELLFRLGGDEFLALRPGPPPAGRPQQAETWARQLGAALEEPVVVQGIELRCSASIGLTEIPAGGRYEALVREADLALRAAREQGRGGLRRYEAALDVDTAQHLSLLAALRQSLDAGGFALHYQPKIELASGRAVAAEALLRWRQPNGSWVEPAQFIPLAERSGLILELGAWALRQACTQAATWRCAGWAEFRVAVNVSAVQLRRDDFAALVLDCLHDAALPAEALLLELTESAFTARQGAEQAQLRRLHEAGVQLVIDDFGTGYSNLGYLARLPVQQLKIDQSFVRELPQSAAARGIVETVITLANRLGLQTVAEGIEDPERAAELARLGCDYGQGHHWSPALPPVEFWRRYGAEGTARA